MAFTSTIRLRDPDADPTDTSSPQTAMGAGRGVALRPGCGRARVARGRARARERRAAGACGDRDALDHVRVAPARALRDAGRHAEEVGTLGAPLAIAAPPKPGKLKTITPSPTT